MYYNMLGYFILVHHVTIWYTADDGTSECIAVYHNTLGCYSMIEGEWRAHRCALRRIGSRRRDTGGCDACMLLLERSFSRGRP